MQSVYLAAADAILVLHSLFVAFVVLGLVAIYLGYWRAWHWVRNFRFRILHLAAIVFVVLQSWLGAICPLTVWESRLREKAGSAGYSGTFIQHHLERILYYDLEEWVFIVVYTIFGGLVLVSWFIVRPVAK